MDGTRRLRPQGTGHLGRRPRPTKGIDRVRRIRDSNNRIVGNQLSAPLSNPRGQYRRHSDLFWLGSAFWEMAAERQVYTAVSKLSNRDQTWSVKARLQLRELATHRLRHSQNFRRRVPHFSRALCARSGKTATRTFRKPRDVGHPARISWIPYAPQTHALSCTRAGLH